MPIIFVNVCFELLLSQKLGETSNRVRKMLAQLTALLGSLGYLEGQKAGQDFLEFIVKLCALPTSEQRSVASSDILQYLTSDNSNYSGHLLFINYPFYEHKTLLKMR